MILGNKIYDDNFQGLLPADEILSSSVGVNLSLVGEVFCQLGNKQSVVDLLTASTDWQVSGGVLVFTPCSFSICYDTMHVILFDSHSHN